MSELAATAAHESRHVAASLLLDLPLRYATLTSATEGHVKHAVHVTRDTAPRIVQMILAGVLYDGGPPDWPPSPTGRSKDERQLASLSEYLDLDREGWDALVTQARQLTAQHDFALLEEHLAELLCRHRHLNAHDLQKVYDAVITKAYDEDRAGERDPDGCLSDEAIDYSLDYSREREEAEAQHLANDYHDIETKAFNEITAVLLAA